MNTEQKELIQKFLKEGKDRHATRRAYISEGLSTENFDAEYESILSELGVEEPKQALPSFQTIGEAPLRDIRPSVTRRRFSHGAKMLVLLLILAAPAIFGAKYLLTQFFLSDIGSQIQAEEASLGERDALSFGDSILQTKVEATAASAEIHGRRLLSYDGVCSDITVVAPIVCSGTTESYAIFAEMSNGMYFCHDGAGFKDLIEVRPTIAGRCTQ